MPKVSSARFHIAPSSPFASKGLFRSPKDSQLSATLEHEAPGFTYTSPKQEVNAMEKRLAVMQDAVARLNRHCADFETASSDLQGVTSEHKSLLLQHSELMEKARSFLDDVDREVVEMDVLRPDDQQGLDDLQSLMSSMKEGLAPASSGLIDWVPAPSIPQLHLTTPGAIGLSQDPAIFAPPAVMGSPAFSFTFGVAGNVPQNVGPCYVPKVSQA